MAGTSKNVAIVTGAAGGMGSASAAVLARDGWPLILIDISAERTEAVAAPLRADGLSVEVLAGDVSAPDFIDRLTALLGDRPIGAVVHAAGLSPTMGDAERIFAVNYDATSRLVALIRPRIVAGGCAVLISSSSAYEATDPAIEAAIKAIGPDGTSETLLPLVHGNSGYAYMVSKLGVQLIVQQQATAFGARGARIMSISPGLIDTSMGRQEAQAHPQMDAMLQKTPLGRYGTSEEIATVAAFLVSPAASYVSGSDIKVDGGVIASMHW
jgi:NAD(P)-dependent dehydrogenase (short-subunit alcohol dehydrogenase family)